MPPKYKLHSSGDEGAVKKCAFYLSSEGCKNGSNCKFSHGEEISTPKKCVSVGHESSSVVSSESSDEESFAPPRPPKSTEKAKKPNKVAKAKNSQSKPEEDQFQMNLRLLQEQQKKLVELQQQILQQQKPGSVPKQKTKKRKQQSQEHETSIFANPSQTKSTPAKKSKASTPTPKKNRKVQVDSYAALAQSSEASDNNDESEDDEGLNYLAELRAKLNKNIATPSKQNKKKIEKSKTNHGFSFASKLDLPIAPFNTKDTNKAKDTKSSQVSVSSEDDNFPSPLPNRSSHAYEFTLAIQRTRDHPRFTACYDLAKKRAADDISEQNWIRTKPISRKTSSNPRVIAIDCEMVETHDPDTGKRDHKALARISVVNALDTSEVLLDTLVKPSAPVRDHRTFVNGITRESLEDVKFTLEHAQAFMMALCDEETVIIGHAVHNDLVALKMEHFCNVDTSYLFKVKGDDTEGKSATPSLKDCATLCLGKDMPDTHCSVNDAITALECCVYFLKNKGKVGEVTKTERKKYDGSDTLLVHRIPSKGCSSKDITYLFLNNCHIKPKEVEEISFSSSTGKTNVIFSSKAHAQLAFDTLSGSIQTDKTGRDQKKIYLRNGNYIQVRKMTRPKKQDSILSPKK